jgi:hypothetical protein
LNEQSQRRFVAMEAQALGRGGVSLMAQISGLARRMIYHGLGPRHWLSESKFSLCDRRVDMVIMFSCTPSG